MIPPLISTVTRGELNERSSEETCALDSAMLGLDGETPLIAHSIQQPRSITPDLSRWSTDNVPEAERVSK